MMRGTPPSLLLFWTNGRLSFDASTNTYIFYDSENSPSTYSTYGPGDIVGAPANFTARRHVVTTGPDVGKNEDLQLFVSGSANTQLSLTYVSYGIHIIWDLSSPYDRKDYFIFGVPTPNADIPTTGSATYTGIAEGAFIDIMGVPFKLSGSSGLTADFAAGTVGVTLDLTGQTAVVGAAPFSPVHYDGTGSFTNPALDPHYHYMGTLLSPSNAGYSGSFQGRFFGPTANEYGFQFSVSQPGGGGVGVAVGK